MATGLSEAAATGVNRSTIYLAWKSGLSALRHGQMKVAIAASNSAVLAAMNATPLFWFRPDCNAGNRCGRRSRESRRANLSRRAGALSPPQKRRVFDLQPILATPAQIYAPEAARMSSAITVWLEAVEFPGRLPEALTVGCKSAVGFLRRIRELAERAGAVSHLLPSSLPQELWVSSTSAAVNAGWLALAQ